MNAPMPSLVVIAAPVNKEASEQRSVRERLLGQGRSRGWNVLPLVRPITVGYVGEAAGRKVDVLSPQDTKEIYRLAHAVPLVVLATAAFKVRPDPSRDPVTDRSLVSAQSFLCHKAHFSQVRAMKHVDGALNAAEVQLDALSCDGMGDPRVLPMHVFAPEGCVFDLATLAGRRAFQKCYGPASCRTDPDRRTWRTGPSHGREVLYVGRVPLPVGFHWDVTKSSGGRRCRIVNGWQVWELTGVRGYANISPDAAVRRGNNECVVRWP